MKSRSLNQGFGDFGDQKFKAIISDYKARFVSCKQEPWIEFSRNQRSLRDAVRVSSLCINEEGKRHPHQYRIPQKVLEGVHIELVQNIRKVNRVRSFDELYQLISSFEIFGIGKLTTYDIATRIGAYLKLKPDRVYLHAGTRTGAKKLLGKISKPYLIKDDLPKPFRTSSLSYSEIEDILCIYKDDFGKG